MLKKLRNRLLIVCMVMTLFVFFAAFAIVYITMSERITAENELKLSYAVDTGKQLGAGDSFSISNNSGNGLEIVANLSTITITCDKTGKVLAERANKPNIEISDVIYKQARESALNNTSINNYVNFADRKWLYDISEYAVTERVNDNNIEMKGTNTQITFLDITETAKILSDLLATFMIVGLVLIVILFLTSLYLANRAIKPVKLAWEKQRQFVADASHELKTPLAVLTSTYSALQDSKDETIESQSEFFGYMKSGMDRMAKLIEDLLSLARMENTSRIITCAPFDIGAEVEKATRKFETLIREKSVAFSCSIEPDVMIDSDQTLAMGAFEILFDNAVKYVNEDGKIDVTLKKEKHGVICTIGNSGAGINKADLSKIFDRFYRADRSRSSETGGYGLGLAIAKSIMDSLGGKIEATSENGWTEFELRF